MLKTYYRETEFYDVHDQGTVEDKKKRLYFTMASLRSDKSR